MKRRVAAICVVMVGCTLPLAANAQQKFPNKPIRIIVPFSTSTQTDFLARMLGQKLTEKWEQQVIVDNRPGGGGTIGAKMLLGANADGHNLLLVSAAHAIHPTLYRNLPYDPVRDFAGVSQIASVPLIVVMAPSQGVKSVKELIALARQKPGQLTFGSSGSGSATHLAGEQLKLAARLNVVHVPYKSFSDALVDVATGRIHYLFSPPTPTMPFILEKRLLPLAVTTIKRLPLLPEVPTVAEAGVPGYELDVWFAILASRKTPRPLIQQLNAEIRRVLERPDIRDSMLKNGMVPKASTPEELDAFIKSEVEKLGKVVKASGARAD